MTRERYESLPLATLKELAKARNMKGVSTLKKSALIDEMLKLDETEKQMQANEKAKEEVRQEMKEKKEESDIEQLDSGKTAKGIFELHQDGYGFIRSDNYLPGEQDVEIEGTEPYIVGGHTASGYWVDTNRETTIHGLYAAGDVAGGCPQKYVTGALAEGELAAKAIEAQLIGNAKVSDGKAGSFENDLAKKAGSSQEKIKKYIEAEAGQEIDAYRHILSEHKSSFTAEELEEAMQKVMDEYAGGISTHYQYNEKQLKLADEKIDQLIALADQLAAENMHELLFVYELKERLIVCKSLIAHLRGRKETRWHSFNENLDYPETDENYFKYVNSRLVDGKLQIILRDIVKEGSYEHTN